MMIPETMSGVQLIGHGGLDMLIWNEAIPTPRPGPGKVLVRVLAAGVNNTDLNTRIGWYSREISSGTAEGRPSGEIIAGGWSGQLSFPLIQGGDLCGKVVAMGDGVTGFNPGARVTCPTNQPNPTREEPARTLASGSEYDGAFAQYCVVPADQLYDVSAAPLSDVEIAAIPCAHGTAFNLLCRARAGPGDRVLVTGASGGVGLAVVEMAKLKGAHVTAISGADKHDAVRAAGADRVLQRGETPAARQFTVAIDVVGGPNWGRVIEALEPGGRYAVAGAIAGPLVQADLRTLYLHDLTLYGCTYTPREVFADLIARVNAGEIRPLISRTYPLSDIRLAQADFATKRYPGKLVLIPPSEAD